MDAANLPRTDAGDLHLFADPQPGTVLDDGRDVALPEGNEADGRDGESQHRRHDDADQAEGAGAEPLEDGHRHAAE